MANKSSGDRLGSGVITSQPRPSHLGSARIFGSTWIFSCAGVLGSTRVLGGTGVGGSSPRFGFKRLLYFGGVSGQGRQLARVPSQWFGRHGHHHAKLHHFVEGNLLDTPLIVCHLHKMRVRLGKSVKVSVAIEMAGVARQPIGAEFGI